MRILVEAIEKARRSTLPLHEMFEQLMIDVGYIDMLKNDLEDNRIDIIHEVQRSIYDFQVSHEDAPTLENYLQDISLYTDNDSIDQGQYVSLMSIHMAKGLEFDYVFVLGLLPLRIIPSFPTSSMKRLEILGESVTKQNPSLSVKKSCFLALVKVTYASLLSSSRPSSPSSAKLLKQN